MNNVTKVLMGIALTFSAGAVYSQPANFADGVLTIPVVAVGDTFYRLELNLTNAQTFEFGLGPFEILINPITTGMSEFNNPILSIPEVVVGSTSYRLELTLTDASTFTFLLSDYEELNDTGADPLAFSFFVTSQGSGSLGGNLGGLTGADAICQELATAAGVGEGTWRAYLSTTTENARDRIGTGPWINFAGETIAANVEFLHADGVSNGDPQHILDETGNPVEVGGQIGHDIFTGSEEDGTVATDATCQDWTSSSVNDVGRIGHSDTNFPESFSYSWNSAHDTLDCSEAGVLDRGGIGRLYCFAQ